MPSLPAAVNVANVATRLRAARRGVIIGGGVIVLFAGIALAVVNPFTADHGRAAALDNGAPTGLATVERRPLSAQQTLVGVVGYAGSWTVAVPGATSAGDLQQAVQQSASAQASLISASATLNGDHATLTVATAAAQAARAKEVSDCAGVNAAVAATTAVASGTATPSVPPNSTNTCASSMQAAVTNQAAVEVAREKVAADRAQVTAAEKTLSSAQGALHAAQSTSTSYSGSAIFTSLPAVGDVVTRGQALYEINGVKTLLFYGDAPAWRNFTAGMSPGHDVSELNANLRALGYGDPTGDTFTDLTGQAIEAIQRARRLPVTGSFALGAVVFEPSAARVTSVASTVGQSAQPGAIMTLSSTRHDVSIDLNAAQQSQVKVGNRVLITLPDNSTTPGIVDFVGKVATSPGGAQNAGGGAGAPSLPVRVRFLRPSVAGELDQAPVNILVTTATVQAALVVPVNALIALAGGGYAIEVVGTGGAHHLVAVTPGLFDDQEGLVQIKGSGVAANQRIVVPSS